MISVPICFFSNKQSASHRLGRHLGFSLCLRFKHILEVCLQKRFLESEVRRYDIIPSSTRLVLTTMHRARVTDANGHFQAPEDASVSTMVFLFTISHMTT